MGKSYQITETELKALEELRRQNKDKDAERRLHAVILRGKGMRNIEVAKKLDTAPQVISYWVSRFKREGVDGLLEHRKGGNHRNMTYEEEEEILQKFRDKAIRGEVVTLREIKAAYEERTGQPLGSYSQIYKLLHRHKWRKIKPRPKHEKAASPEAIEASKKLTQL